MAEQWSHDLGVKISSYSNLANELEVEFRLGHKTTGDVYTNQVKYAYYSRLQKILESMVQGKKISISDTKYRGDIRCREIAGVVTWEKKTSLAKLDDDKYFFRIALSREQQITAPTNPGDPILLRTLTRTSYPLGEWGLTVEMSQVVQNRNSHFEVEIEVDNPTENLLSLADKMKGVDTILMCFNGTDILYPMKMVEDLNMKVNVNLANSEEHRYISRANLTEARNLKIKDLVYGGIVGGKIKMFVTHKTDGERKLLVYADSGVWLIFPPYEYNLISTNRNNGLTIYDVELIPKEQRKNQAPMTKYWAQVIDILFVKGKDFRPYTFTDRKSVVEKLMRFLPRVSSLSVTSKRFLSFDTTKSFFQSVSQMLDLQDTLDYVTDGLIFTPVNHTYNITHASNVSLKDRVLTKYADILKYKPAVTMTIDFKIIRESVTGRIQLYVADEKTGGDILFVGIKSQPFNQDTMIKQYDEITNELPNGVIIEYAWDYDKGELYPVRPRLEKSGPNRRDVAIDNWLYIIFPISDDDITGRSFSLMFRYHNRIKTRLLKGLEGYTLMDIGSGVGGDVAKWHNFQRVIAVEPDANKIPELTRRINRHGLTDKVVIVNVKGEDTNKILPYVVQYAPQGVDVISAMNSITFHWQGLEQLSGLAQTIRSFLKYGGRFVWIVMDGDTVRAKNSTRLQFGDFSIQRENGRQVLVTMPGTIVETQTEWLVRITDLLYLLPELTEVYRYRADGEKFLNDDSLALTELYSYGYWTRNMSN